MRRDDFADLDAFVTVATERSFTRAAAMLGVSQSALSQTIRALETRLGVRLLTRTTRSVSPTEAGKRLLETTAPRLAEIRSELLSISELRDSPTGTVRITASEHGADMVLAPRLSQFALAHPGINVEVIVEGGFVDLAAERYDMGIRLSDDVPIDMVSVRVGPDHRFALVGAPSYFAKHPRPTKPDDLAKHNCINIRLPTHGGLYAWELKKGRKERNVRVSGQLVFNRIYEVTNAAVAGAGLAFVPEDVAQPHLDAGELVEVMADWSPPFRGYCLYYPSRRHMSKAMALLIDALRYRG